MRIGIAILAIKTIGRNRNRNMTDVNIIKASNVKYYHKITVAEHSLFHLSAVSEQRRTNLLHIVTYNAQSRKE